MKKKKKKSQKPVVIQQAPEKFIDGTAIRHVLVDLNMTQAEIAKEMGVAAATISRIVSGRCVMTLPYYKLFCYTVRELEVKFGKKVNVKY